MLAALKSGMKRVGLMQTARLLFLEFLVVVMGVLVARLLQEWFADRDARARAKIQVEGIAGALHNSAELAVMRQRMGPCILDGLERVGDALAQDRIDQSALGWVRVPEQHIMDDPGIDAARPIITKVFGPEKMMHFSLIEFAYDKLYQGQDRELAAWDRLSLLNPANGPVRKSVRGDLQLALADARQANRLMWEVSGIMRTQSKGLGTPVHEQTIRSFAGSPKLCAKMVGFTPEQHAEALQRGELPDGTAIHPKALERLATGIY